MKPITGLLILAACLMAGCGHQPMGTATPVAIFGQIEHYHITHIYMGDVYMGGPASDPDGTSKPMSEKEAAKYGIGNGATVYGLGTTVFGVQGYKAPTNSNPIGKLPE